ncbi:MAG: 50S ribosomal protein L25 [Vicingaceae bacterium]
MKSVELKATERKDVRSKSRLNTLRKEGRIPAIMYGGKDNINFHIDEVAFEKLINTSEIHLVDLNFGDKTINAVIREVQFHPVTDQPIHVDFMEVSGNVPILMGVPVRFEGTPIGVLNGGKKREKLRKLVLKALPKDIPDEIRVDISKIRIGHGIKVEEIELENVEFMDHPKAVVVAVKTARAAVEETIEDEDEDLEGEEGAEGEDGETSGEAKEEGAEKEAAATE